jgi:hypothetical protein
MLGERHSTSITGPEDPAQSRSYLYRMRAAKNRDVVLEFAPVFVGVSCVVDRVGAEHGRLDDLYAVLPVRLGVSLRGQIEIVSIQPLIFRIRLDEGVVAQCQRLISRLGENFNAQTRHDRIRPKTDFD